MATAVYDTLAGNSNYQVTIPETSSIGYPSSNLYTVFGPVYLPRIYGKDLSSFEIASSGSVAVTLRDVYAFDLDRSAASNMTSLTTAAGDSLQLAVNSNQIGITFDASSNNLNLSASNSIILNAQSLVYNLTGDSASTYGGDASISAAGNFFLGAGSNLNLSASQDVQIVSEGSNVRLFLDHTACNLLEYALHDIQVAASNSLHMEALSNASLTALTGTLVLSAGQSNLAVALDGVDLSASVTAQSNVSLSSTAGSVSASANDGSVTLTLDQTTDSLVAYALSNISLTAAAGGFSAVTSNNILLAASNASVLLNADASRVTLTLDQPTDSILGYALSNTTLVAGRDFTATASNSAQYWAQSNLTLTAASGALSVTLSNDQTLQASAKAYTFAASSNVGYAFNIATSNIMTVQSDKVVVHGGLDVYGTVNSIAVNNTELHINDRTVQLSYPISGETIEDGVTNTASGMVVSGLPASASNLDPVLAANIYDKSFKWNFGASGIDAMLTNPGISTEAFWELRGGRFQMSSTKSDGKNISFALRINELDELEFVKIWDDADSVTQTRRIAKFGRTLF